MRDKLSMRKMELFGAKPLRVGKSSFGKPKLNHATELGIRGEGAFLTMRVPMPTRRGGWRYA